MPAISSFEDKLKENNDHNDRLDVMLRRIDEVLCNKADKQQLKEFREDVSQTYVTKTDNGDLKNDVNKQIVDFTERITEMDTVIKFQVRQLQKEMFSAVRRTFNQHKSKEENQPVSMANVID